VALYRTFRAVRFSNFLTGGRSFVIDTIFDGVFANDLLSLITMARPVREKRLAAEAAAEGEKEDEKEEEEEDEEEDEEEEEGKKKAAQPPAPAVPPVPITRKSGWGSGNSVFPRPFTSFTSPTTTGFNSAQGFQGTTASEKDQTPAAAANDGVSSDDESVELIAPNRSIIKRLSRFVPPSITYRNNNTSRTCSAGFALASAVDDTIWFHRSGYSGGSMIGMLRQIQVDKKARTDNDVTEQCIKHIDACLNPHYVLIKIEEKRFSILENTTTYPIIALVGKYGHSKFHGFAVSGNWIYNSYDNNCIEVNEKNLFDLEYLVQIEAAPKVKEVDDYSLADDFVIINNADDKNVDTSIEKQDKSKTLATDDKKEVIDIDDFYDPRAKYDVHPTVEQYAVVPNMEYLKYDEKTDASATSPGAPSSVTTWDRMYHGDNNGNNKKHGNGNDNHYNNNNYYQNNNKKQKPYRKSGTWGSK
jgi:hypothetical protein